MTAAQLLQLLTSVTFVLVFVTVTVRAIRRPSRESLDIALFFGAPAVAITQSWIAQTLGVRDTTLSLTQMRVPSCLLATSSRAVVLMVSP